MKELVRQRGLAVGGNKTVLADRLIATDSVAAATLASRSSVLICTHEGAGIARKYVEYQKQKRAEMESEVESLLVHRKFEEACEVVASFERCQVFPRGLGIDWNTYTPEVDIPILKLVFTGNPQILKGISNSEIESLRVPAAMAFLLGTGDYHRLVPKGLLIRSRLIVEDVARMLVSFAVNRNRIQQGIKHGDRVFEVSCGGAPCGECLKLQGKRFSGRKMPELPYPNCICEDGCKCEWVPVLRRSQPK